MSDTVPFFPYPAPMPPSGSMPSSLPMQSPAITPPPQKVVENSYRAVQENAGDQKWIKIGYFILGFTSAFVVAFLSSMVFFTHRDEQKPQNTVTPPAIILYPSHSQLIRASKGGKLISMHGGEVEVPQGALEKDTQLSITFIKPGEVTDLYKLEPDGMSFLKPVIVRLPYKEKALTQNKKIKLEIWAENEKKRKLLPFTVDKTNKKLEAQVTNF